LAAAGRRLAAAHRGAHYGGHAGAHRGAHPTRLACVLPLLEDGSDLGVSVEEG